MKIKETLKNYIRILKIMDKPTKDEFWTTVKICLIGIGLFGLIGFIFYILFNLFYSLIGVV